MAGPRWVATNLSGGPGPIFGTVPVRRRHRGVVRRPALSVPSALGQKTEPRPGASTPN